MRKKQILIIIAAILTAVVLVNYLPFVSDWNQKNIDQLEANENYCFSVIGDIHNNVPGFNMFLKSLNLENSFVIVNGDFIHFGANEEYNFATTLFKQINIPTIVTIGNHEVWNGNNEMFEEMFGPTYFSFNFSDDLFIILDNSEESIDLDQYEWLKQELDKESRNTFVVMHRPIFDPWQGEYYTDDANILASLFKEKNVTLVIASDRHKYNEFYYDDIRYMLTGTIGGDTNDTFSYSDVCVNSQNITLNNIITGQQSQDEQAFHNTFILLVIILYKAVLIAIALHIAIMYLRKNFGFKD